MSWHAIRSNLRRVRQQYLVSDAWIKQTKANWSDAARELLGQNPNSIEQTLSRGSRAHGSNHQTSRSADSTQNPSVGGPSALVIVKPTDSAWERVSARLRETPIIQSMMDAAAKAKQSKAGQTLGAARRRLGDVQEDAREYWETSQNPWVYRLSSVYDGLFGETETAAAIREIRRADPGFNLDEWKDEIGEHVIPVVLQAFLKGESRKLKTWMGEAAYNTVNAAIRERKAEGLIVNPTVLALENVEVIAAKAEEIQSPIVVLQFMAQQIHCIKSRDGTIVEGADDDVRAVYYALAFQRDYDEDRGVLRWKIIEMAMLGAVPYV